MADGPLDDCLSVRGGRLFIEGCDVDELADRFGTPVYVVSEDQLRRNARRLTAAFAAHWDGPVRVLPSIKANQVLALRRILSAEGLGCDTFGRGELWAALACEVPPALISVNGSGKSEELVREAVAAGCRITLDAPRELDLVIDAARRLGRRATVRVRLRPDLSVLDQVPSDFSPEGESITEISHRYKAGIPFGELLPLGERLLGSEHVELVGVHAHFARHSRDPAVWEAMARAYGEAILRVSAAWQGWLPSEIDVGGGLPAARDPTGRALARLQGRGPAPAADEYARAICAGLRRALAGSRLETARTTLELEPGRACYANVGIHLSRVVNLKTEREPAPLRFVELDTTEMFLLDIHLEHNRFAHVVTGRAAEPLTTVADLVGCSCGFDTITPDAELPAGTAPGDVIAFLDTGAYQEVSANNFNALPRPATVLVSGSSARVVRRVETVEDVFARDLEPGELDHMARATRCRGCLPG